MSFFRREDAYKYDLFPFGHSCSELPLALYYMDHDASRLPFLRCKVGFREVQVYVLVYLVELFWYKPMKC